MITDLTKLGLSADAVAGRVRSIGGSDANTIMSGDEAAILALWETKTGRRDPDDLTDVLAVMMGQFTEPLNAAWFQKQTGLVITERDVPLSHAADAWRTATLDGRTNDGAIWEAKHLNAFAAADAQLAKYQPQLHHNMDVDGARLAHLSIFRGNADWVHFPVPYNEEYGAAVRQAEWEFWMAVQSDEPPVPYPVAAPPAADAMREVDMTASNAWGQWAPEWLSNRASSKKFDEAAKELKALVEADVKLASGHGVKISRSKSGSLLIGETK